MNKRNIDIPLDGVGESKRSPRRSGIDIPLDGGNDDGISEKEFEFVNRHHEEYKELRRRAREQGGY